MNPIEIGQENFQIDFNIWVTDIKLSKGQLHTKFDIVDFDKSTHQSITLTQAYLNKVGNYDKKISATIKDNIISFFRGRCNKSATFLLLPSSRCL